MNHFNFEKHLEKLASQIYSEPPSSQHTNASKELIEEFCRDLSFQNVVELGCGTAPCLDILKSWGKETFGVTAKGEIVNHSVYRGDMHFTGLADQSYDLVIARHALEHSPMPLILLMEGR